MSDTRVVSFADEDNDILQVDETVDENGQRYVAVIRQGHETGVLLDTEQQAELASLLGFRPWLAVEERGEVAERAANILRASGVFGSPSPLACEVVKLAEWIAHGYNHG